MNMTSVRCFMKVVEYMSFSKAAEALYISQQAVSLHIKRLEDEYHVILFERRPALKLTESGRLLLEAAKDILDREEELIGMLSQQENSFHGDITIGLPPNRSAAFASEYIPLFCKKFPNMTVSLQEKTSAVLPSAVMNNEVDLAVLLVSPDAAYPDSLYFHSQPLITENMYMLVSDDLLMKNFPANFEQKKLEFSHGVDILDFASIPMFLRPMSSGTHREIVEYMISNGKKPIIRVQSTTTSALIPLCAQGLGILFCSSSLLQHVNMESSHHISRINCFPVRHGCRPRELVLTYHKKKKQTLPIQESVRIIRSIYASDTHRVPPLHLVTPVNHI